MAVTASTCVLPMTPAVAQVRALPDFTDLVEQVGPSVVNIRTLEKANPRQNQTGQMDPDMLEFFRRFGLPIPNVPMVPGKLRRPDMGRIPTRRSSRVAWVQASS